MFSIEAVEWSLSAKICQTDENSYIDLAIHTDQEYSYTYSLWGWKCINHSVAFYTRRVLIYIKNTHVLYIDLYL